MIAYGLLIAAIVGGYFLVGLYIAFRFGRFLWVYWLFWLGKRRDLYFMPSEERAYLLGVNLGGFCTCLVWILGPFGLYQARPLSGFECALPHLSLFWGAMSAYFAFPHLDRILPRWVVQFEAAHSAEEIILVQHHGQQRLQEFPKTFIQVISTPEGWDLWIMTEV